MRETRAAAAAGVGTAARHAADAPCHSSPTLIGRQKRHERQVKR
jgi:hypothetical protein